MFDAIRRNLSLKITLILTVVSIPPMLLAAYAVTAHETAKFEELVIDNGKIAAATGAKMYGSTLEAGIDAGLFTLRDLLEPEYEEIKGYDFGTNPRFHTKYDYYTDRTVLDFENSIVDTFPSVLYANGGDWNGYVPTHDTRFSAPMTGDKAKDLNGNRDKRKFTTPMHVRAAKNLEPVLVQDYTSDAGKHLWDVSSPIFVKGRHFGAFRVGVSRDSIGEQQSVLLLQIALVFAGLVLITVGAIFIMVRRAMRPLARLSEAADHISSGEELDKPIKSTSTDEVGRMAKSLNRLRSSLQAAMGRLGS